MKLNFLFFFLCREAAELERLRQIEEELIKEKEMKKEGMRRRKEKFAAREKTEEELRGFSKLNMDNVAKGIVRAVHPKESASTGAGGLWTDDDLAELIRLVKKYPSGSASRWDTIGEAMNRSVTEVTFMAAKMKENGYRVPGHTDSVAENIMSEATKKVKTKPPVAAAESQTLTSDTIWSQEQQQLLELAIVKYPKTVSTDRWQKISNSVPGKTKEECLARYRYLVELVKAQQKTKASVVAVEEDIVECEQSEKDEEQFDVDTMCTVDAAERQPVVERKGKPKNKRKERKKRMDFSSSEEESDYDNTE